MSHAQQGKSAGALNSNLCNVTDEKIKEIAN